MEGGGCQKETENTRQVKCVTESGGGVTLARGSARICPGGQPGALGLTGPVLGLGTGRGSWLAHQGQQEWGAWGTQGPRGLRVPRDPLETVGCGVGLWTASLRGSFSNWGHL